MKSAYEEIDIKAIRYNINNLVCQYKKKIIAVIKDDAYGLGAIKIAKGLCDIEDICFAVNNIDEAVELRNNGITNKIILLGYVEESDLKEALDYDLDVLLTCMEQARYMSNSKVKVHIKINSGMNRLGLSATEFINNYKDIKATCNVVGIMSHFATSDDDYFQYNVYKSCLENIDLTGLMIHCFSSRSIRCDDITTHARIGIKMYGFSERSSIYKNALSLYSPIIAKYKVYQGQTVGYDFSYRCPSDGYLYILPIGYSHGFGNFKKSFAYYDYKYLTQAGKISMDFSCYFSKIDIKKDAILELIGLNVPLEHLSINNEICLQQLLVNLRKITRIYL